MANCKRNEKVAFTAYWNAVSLKVRASSQENTERPYDIHCRQFNLVLLRPDTVWSVTAIITKVITMICRCICFHNTGRHLSHCMEAIIRTVASIPCHPTHSKKLYNAVLYIYIATQLKSTKMARLRHNCCRHLGKAKFYENIKKHRYL